MSDHHWNNLKSIKADVDRVLTAWRETLFSICGVIDFESIDLETALHYFMAVLKVTMGYSDGNVKPPAEAKSVVDSVKRVCIFVKKLMPKNLDMYEGLGLAMSIGVLICAIDDAKLVSTYRERFNRAVKIPDDSDRRYWLSQIHRDVKKARGTLTIGTGFSALVSMALFGLGYNVKDETSKNFLYFAGTVAACATVVSVYGIADATSLIADLEKRVGT